MNRAFVAGSRDSSGRPGPRYWQLRTDYTIDARIDPETAIVTARETVVIHNASSVALNQIVLRLDQNFFRPDGPAWSMMGTSRDTTDGMIVTRLAMNGRAVSLHTVAGLATTVATVSLAVPLPAHGRATMEIDWHFRVPKRGIRMGGSPETGIYLIGQWYPRVAIYDDLRGWRKDPYLGNTEFFNNYGRFDVTLDVPAGWLVGATGVLQNSEQVLTPASRTRLADVLKSDSLRAIVSADDRGLGSATAAGTRLRWRFVADTASDFAWSTSDRYEWYATRATIPTATIPVHLFYPAAGKNNKIDELRRLRHGLELYSALLAPYPFLQLTMVPPAMAGMEYPMLIMTHGRANADHEVGHQWFPMLVGSNETWYPWMDEGFNEYINIYSDASWGRTPPRFDKRGKGRKRDRAPWIANANESKRVADMYGDPPQMLAMLGGVVGDSAVKHALRGYVDAWRFKHPSPWDFMFFMNQALKQDLGWFWYAWLFTSESVDGSIESMTTQGRQTMVTVRQSGGMPSPVVLQVKFAAQGPPLKLPVNAQQMDSVTAVVTYPVDVWFDGRRTFTASLDFGGRTPEQVVLDPAERFPDAERADNVWPRP